MADTEDAKPQAEPFDLKEFIRKWLPLILLGLMLAKTFGWISPEQASEIKEYITVQDDQEQKQKVEPTPEPPTPDVITPDKIEEIIRKLLKEAQEAKEEPKPTPAADDTPSPAPQPAPPAQAKIRLCDESGNELTDAAIEAGELFRVSAVNCGPEIGWHPVESGDVKLSASTDGKEFCGYLDAGQWVEFSLTDFASKTQASLRVTCLTAPQPPPDPKPDDETRPKPQPTAKNVRIFVVHNVNRITPDAAIVLNANDMWDKFTADGNDWKFIDISTDDAYEKKIVADASGIGLPAIVVYDKSSGKKLTAEELPKSVIATEGLIERYTGGDN